MPSKPTSRRAAAILPWLAALAACATPTPSTTLAPIQAVTIFDGFYNGSVRTTGRGVIGEVSWCDTMTALSFRITDSQFSFNLPHPNVPGNPTIVFAVYVPPDGRIETQSNDGSAELSGLIADGRFQGGINGAGCQYGLMAFKS